MSWQAEKRFHVIPGCAEGANPESSQVEFSRFWIPDRRFAASGMTQDTLFSSRLQQRPQRRRAG